jgi:membrane-bound lytic murein transglycosylase MltF
MVSLGCLLGLAGAQAAAPASAPAAAAAASAAADARRLPVTAKAWTGDFDQMLERRRIRVAIPYSRSLYFIDKGRERGLSAELVRDFERWVNKTYAKQLGKRPLTVYVASTTRDQLFVALNEGLVDMAVGNLSVTDERKQLVDFVAPDAKSVNVEILVTGASGPALSSVDELSGQTVHVRESSSYHASLLALNQRLKQSGKPPVKLVLVPDALEDEDMLEMVNAGLIGAVVIDQWKARLWASVLPKIELHEDVVLRDVVPTGWAIRKNSPQLQAVLNDFYTKWVVSAGVVPYRQREYMKRIKAMNNSAAAADRKRFQDTIALFRKYGAQYGFDPLMLAAQGYQESTLDQNKKSHVGAIGVMQIMPATGAELKVGDIKSIEPNIHGGTKYMDQLMTRYFKDAHFSETNRTLFAFASYNAGPGNISKMRKEAEKRGLDPDKWFNNVELVTAEKIGMETTTYVRNIYKYYVSYKLAEDAHAEAEALKQQAAPAKK